MQGERVGWRGNMPNSYEGVGKELFVKKVHDVCVIL